MGEAFPPTATDYTHQEARDAKAMAQGTIMRIQQLEQRIDTLEHQVARVITLVDEAVSALALRIERLEVR